MSHRLILLNQNYILQISSLFQQISDSHCELKLIQTSTDKTYIMQILVFIYKFIKLISLTFDNITILNLKAFEVYKLHVLKN